MSVLSGNYWQPVESPADPRPWLEVRRWVRERSRPRRMRSGLVAFAFVLLAGLSAGAWIGARVDDLHLDGLAELSDSLGFGRPERSPHPQVGYVDADAAP